MIYTFICALAFHRSVCFYCKA